MAMSEILNVANSWQLWVICALLVLWVCAQAAMFVRLCYKEAAHIGYPTKKLKTAVVNGMVTAIGPAFAGVVVMISMIAVLGAPITWERLSIIGAAQTELTAANIGAQAMGVELGGEGFTLQTLAMCFLIMAINGCGWLLMTTICTPSMEKVRTKLSGGDMVWLGLLSAGATLGMFSNLTAQRLIANNGTMVAAIVGFGVQFILEKLVVPRAKWIKGYSLAISLICGIVTGYLIRPV